ncbi:MAG: hypothetical protein WA211_21180 [Candidatus Acidiferrales bacterium]
MKLRELWSKLISTRYVAVLEADVARLRAENRALLNSILGIAGVPPIAITGDDPTLSARPAAVTNAGAKSATSSDGSARVSAKNMTSVAAPTRRRSWHQVYRMLEIDSARKREVI